MLYIDLDGFKPVNDRLGHAAGDQLLVEVGERLSRTVRAGDSVIRIGGDEFAVVCPGCSPDDLGAFAERIRTEVRAIASIEGAAAGVTASIGCAHAPRARPGELVAVADAALGQAKGAGRDRVSWR